MKINITVPCLRPPHPQAEIIRYVPKSKAEIVIALGGYGSSKSRTGTEWALQMSLRNLGCVHMEVAPTYPMLRDILLELWHDRLTDYGMDFGKLFHKSDRVLNLPWGSRVWFRSADNPMHLRGPSIGSARIDEDCGLEACKVVFDRIRDPRAKHLAMAITTTPDFSCLDEVLSIWPGAKVYNMSSLDNYMLPEEVRQGLLQTYAGQEAECYVYGKAVKLSGQVFPTFSEEQEPAGNLTDREYTKGYPHFCTVDFGARHPAVLTLQEINGNIYQVDEWAPLSGHHLINNIEEQLRKYGDPAWVYCDPAGEAVNDQTYLSDIKYLVNRGFDVRYTFNPMLRAIPLGIQLLNGLFCNAKGERRFFINRARCPITIRDIRASKYPKEGRANLKDEPVKNGVHDHTRDALRYFAINRYGRDWLKNRRLLKEGD
jgi:hypothetical protein